MADSEKITINMGAVDLGKVDLLVSEGVFSNRTDFIRTAIRNQLDKHEHEVRQSVTRNAYVMGLVLLNRQHLERAREKGQRMDLRVLGLLNVANDVPAELARETIERVSVRGMLRASEPVKRALQERMA